jgi:hypothetical protein
MDKRLYPENWADIARAVKDEAGWKCEECRRPCRMPGESIALFCERVKTGRMSECEIVRDVLDKPTRYVLTVAHLDHQPQNCDRANLRALCAPCHCRYDLAAMALKKRLKAERLGQLNLGV